MATRLYNPDADSAEGDEALTSGWRAAHRLRSAGREMEAGKRMRDELHARRQSFKNIGSLSLAFHFHLILSAAEQRC